MKRTGKDISVKTVSFKLNAHLSPPNLVSYCVEHQLGDISEVFVMTRAITR